MRKFSRWMPGVPVRKTPWWKWPILALSIAGLGFLLYRIPWLLIGIAVLILFCWWSGVRRVRRMRIQALQRSGEDICSFVRDFNPRGTDPWILRAVYEELSRHLQVDGQPFPIHAEDRWKEDLQIDSEDMDLDLLPDIAHRAGRSLADTKKNPFYDRVKTVRDLVSFLDNQPQLQNGEHIGAVRAG